MKTWRQTALTRVLAVGALATGLSFSACSDDADDGDNPGGSGGAAAGKGGSSAAGQTTAGSPPHGGSAGRSAAGSGPGDGGGEVNQGGSTAGIGGTNTAGAAGGNDGGNGANGGAGQAGNGAGQGGNGAGQAGNGGVEQGGNGGSEPGSVEYRACEVASALTRINVHRIDESAGTCTRVVLLQGSSCSLGVAAGGWCLEQAQLSADLSACKALTALSGAKLASSASGTISVSGSTADVNVMLQFPAGGGLPTSVTVAADDCTADCMLNDCRP